MAATKDFSASGESTIIGPSILINGKLSGDEDLTVRGRVEGELSLTKTLIVEPSGVVKANVQVRNAIISGVVVGNISATESVELTREGRMVGDIHSPRVIIVDGASFRGRVDMGNAEPRPASERPAQRANPISRPIVRPAIAAAPARPTIVSRPMGKPQPPAAPVIASKVDRGEAHKPAPPPPPQPVLVGEAGKKKVLLKKKK
ncbi:MAG: polymer-forming cytoskeletal protein [Archangium sp.]|nr:polymer-forming cytoskeletal protein [Archangium sp.]